jgi:hypothetical protein
MNDFNKLGSINNFAESYGMDPKSPITLARYTEILADRRAAVAQRAYSAALAAAIPEPAAKPFIKPDGMHYTLP